MLETTLGPRGRPSELARLRVQGRGARGPPPPLPGGGGGGRRGRRTRRQGHRSHQEQEVPGYQVGRL